MNKIEEMDEQDYPSIFMDIIETPAHFATPVNKYIQISLLECI